MQQFWKKGACGTWICMICFSQTTIAQIITTSCPFHSNRSSENSHQKKYGKMKYDTHWISNTAARSLNTSPTKKCCCLNSADRSAKFALSPPTSVEMNDDWLVDEATEGLGDDGAELGINGVPNGRFNATKCSWLQTMRKKSSWNQQHFCYKMK
jgi:hypothetical protein